MRLALRLGRTLSELRHSLSASEAMMWMEFDRVSPLGDERGDIRNAQIVNCCLSVQRADECCIEGCAAVV
ncbi:phage tail assembly protein T, partial [Escherichia coli]|uniref:phage tail assembly protein T n=1 Tax=Escherichia coli TaxID=562 RepID=UPI00098C0802